MRILANLKRRVTEGAIRGLMASMHANIGTDRAGKEREPEQEAKWRKGREEQTREKGKAREGERKPPNLTIAELHRRWREAMVRIEKLEAALNRRLESSPAQEKAHHASIDKIQPLLPLPHTHTEHPGRAGST